MSNGKVITLIILGCILLAVASVSLWAAMDLFNPERFGERVAEGMQTETSSEALAGPIVDQLLVSYPELPPLARIPAEEIVTWLLQRPVFTPVFKTAAEGASMAMTTSAEDVIEINLGDIESSVINMLEGIEPELGANFDAAFKASEESGVLAVYESGKFPNLRQLSNTVPWLWPLTGIGAIILLFVAFRQAQNRQKALRDIGIGIIITAVAVLLLVPILHAPAQNGITDPVMHTVVSEVLNVLTRGLAVQSLLLGFLGVVAIIFAHTHFKEGNGKGSGDKESNGVQAATSAT